MHVAAQLTLQHGSSLVLARDLFDVVDPDTQLDNLVFTLERAPALCVIEMRSSRTSQRHLLSAGDVFTIHEVRDSTFRIVHSAGDESNNNYQVRKLIKLDKRILQILKLVNELSCN